MSLTTMKELFVHEVADCYDAEHQFLAAQQQMVKKAGDPVLVKALERHITETEGQIAVLEDVFAILGESPRRQPCDGAKGLISEATKAIAEADVEEIRDSIIGGAAAKAESYEINAYTGMVASAELMGEPRIVTLLQKNLKQEERMHAALERHEEPMLKRAFRATGELATAGSR